MILADTHTPQPAAPPHAPGGGDQDAAWISAHLFHRGSLDQLITGAVAPLVEELTWPAPAPNSTRRGDHPDDHHPPGTPTATPAVDMIRTFVEQHPDQPAT